jgi:hypothetical protein
MRRNNPGKRERQAGKRHRRARITMGAMSVTLKVGHKHFRRCMRRFFSVADTETTCKRCQGGQTATPAINSQKES